MNSHFSNNLILLGTLTLSVEIYFMVNLDFYRYITIYEKLNNYQKNVILLEFNIKNTS
jgi:hypothetical protein